MGLTPERIYEEFSRSNLDKNSAIDSLISFIEHSEDEELRLQSITLLDRMNLCDLSIFKLLENLLISDSNWKIRQAAINYILENFKDKAFSIISWALNYEEEYNCYIAIIQALVSIGSAASKSVLFEEIKKIKQKKYLFDDRTNTNRAFRKDIKSLLKKNKTGDLTHELLSEIIVNFITILTLKRKFYNVYYELENALVTTLDLSDIEFEVRGWKAEYKNNIKNLSEITGLLNLKRLKTLYLSNNQISDIEQLIQLKELTILYISKNLLDSDANLAYLKQIKSLKFCDISENKIAEKINNKEFNFELKLRRAGLFI